MSSEPKNKSDSSDVPEYIDSNLTAIIGISLKSFSEKYIDKKTVTFYDLEITSHITQKSWILPKRYNEFKALHNSLSKIYLNLPPIPGTTFFKITSTEQLNKRKSDLEKFLRECVQRKDVFLNQEFRQFLELEKNAPEVIANDVKNKYEYKKLPLGVRGFIVVPHRHIMLVCCSDMNVISRADSMVSNFTFPWEKKDKQYIPLGAAFIYQCKPDPKEIYVIHKIWVKSFPIQTGVIYWDDTNEIYCVGNDDGKIHVFKAVPNTHYLQMETLAELSLHTDRVMGLALDDKTMNLYSCSTDKTFYVTDLKNNLFAKMLLFTNNSGFTNLIFDKENRRIFLTTEDCELLVYSIMTYPPNMVRNLKISALSCIRAAYLDNQSQLFFTGSVNGLISIINIGAPGRERLITEMTSFSIGKMKIRVCVGNSKKNELITGDQVGRVTVWSLKSGKPIYLWEAHPKQAITQMWLQEEENLLWTGGKDMKINIWQLPEKWVSNEAEDYEVNKLKDFTAKIAEKKIIKKYRKDRDGEIDSDEDDLNGWNFREY
jgi:WD40 repeat protein